MSAIPIIDIAPLVNGSPEQAQAVAKALGTACRDVGFFYISGHGVPPELMARVFGTSAAFFGGPAAIRESATFTGPGNNRGYIRLGGEALDPSKPADVKEAFNIGLELAPDDPELPPVRRFGAPISWPDMPGFPQHHARLFQPGLAAGGATCIAGLRSNLGLAPDFFESKLDKPIATLRLLHYPPVKAPLSDGQLGAGVHTDYGNVTLLATDAIGGLMVQDRSGRWLDAPVVPNTFCLQHWRLPDAMVERCLCLDPAQGGQSARRRSLFGGILPRPPIRTPMVACLPTCISSDRPAKYAPDHRRRFPALAARADLCENRLSVRRGHYDDDEPRSHQRRQFGAADHRHRRPVIRSLDRPQSRRRTFAGGPASTMVFFYVVNHGVPPALIDALFEETRRLLR